MGDQRAGGISWTDETWNPIRGCSRVSPGCGGAAGVGGCYAEKVAGRFCGPGLPYEGLATIGKQGARWTGEIAFVREHLEDPIRWARPRRIFVNSMSDLFHEKVPRSVVAAIFGVMGIACHHTYQVLTKRADRMRDIVSSLTLDECIAATVDLDAGVTRAQSKRIKEALPAGSPFLARSEAPLWPLPNVILGVTAEDQQRWDERVPLLLETPAALRMVSVEPQLELVRPDATWAPDTFIAPIDALKAAPGLPVIDWIITGGESGPGARPYDLAWARALREQCDASGTAYFFKQAGSNATDGGAPFRTKHHAGKDPAEWPADLRVQQFPEARP
jgi:protein gp37